MTWKKYKEVSDKLFIGYNYYARTGGLYIVNLFFTEIL